jgi:hypothetical protein
MSTEFPYVTVANYLAAYISGKGYITNFYASQMDSFSIGSEIRATLNVSRS